MHVDKYRQENDIHNTGMKILQVISKKTLKAYFIVLTLAYIILILNLTNDIYAFLTIPYAFLGPVLFFGLNRSLKVNFSSYVEQKYPELMKKHAVEWGVMKGETLNTLSVYQSKKDFESFNDPILMGYFEKGLLLIRLTIFSFILTPIIGIMAMELKT
nr:hypothetical protein [uncultured Fluviicola sp.]